MQTFNKLMVSYDELITNNFRFITDYLAEYFGTMRKRTYGDVIDKFFKLGNNLNQRAVIAVRKTVPEQG